MLPNNIFITCTPNTITDYPSTDFIITPQDITPEKLAKKMLGKKFADSDILIECVAKNIPSLIEAFGVDTTDVKPIKNGKWDKKVKDRMIRLEFITKDLVLVSSEIRN
jgi:hypothetical protein